ncbi:phage tail assembly chaperone [bacterium]|nr:phage tail assembly chaperone [bacterium]
MYVKITNGAVDQFPYTVANLRRDNPNTSFPKKINDEALNSWGVYRVTLEDTPSFNDKTQIVSMDTVPTLVNGTWTVGWTVNNMSQEDIDAKETAKATTLREQRDEKLAETDWWASSDLTMTAEQTAYRQALRDITSHANWPHLEEADWPTKP